MTEQLKPGAFRVWDSDAREYRKDHGWGRNWVLSQEGDLMALQLEGDDYAYGYADHCRYQAERWTGLYDRDERPLFENDVVWYEDLHREGKQSVAVVKMAKGSWLGLVALGDDDFDFSELHDDFWVNLGQFKHTNKPDLKPLDIGTIHDSPETLAAATLVAAAKAASQ